MNAETNSSLAQANKDVSRWVFERSSGYAGWRCQECSTWVYDSTPRKCNCTAINATATAIPTGTTMKFVRGMELYGQDIFAEYIGDGYGDLTFSAKILSDIGPFKRGYIDDSLARDSWSAATN